MQILKASFLTATILALGIGLTAPAQACDRILEPHALECSLQDRYRDVRSALRARHQVEADQITEYRALRFIGRGSWEKAKARGSSDPSQVYTPAPKTWEAWEHGADHADRLPQFSRESFTIDAIRELHRKAMDAELMGRWRVIFKGAAPGKIRSHWWQIPPGFTANCEHGSITEEQARVLLDFDLRDSQGRKLIIANLQPCREVTHRLGTPKNGRDVPTYPGSPYYHGFVSYLGSSSVPAELTRLVDETTDAWSRLAQGDASVKPLELIADTQRRFVAIHPFADGNGRASRFVQDWMLRSLDLPFPASGDLQRDIARSARDYRQDFAEATTRSVVFLETCLERWDAGSPPPECLPLPHAASPNLRAVALAIEPPPPAHPGPRAAEIPPPAHPGPRVAEIPPPSTYMPGFLSKESRVIPNLDHCYRWVSEFERDQWKKGTVYFPGAPINDHLGRGGDGSDLTYCWSNPVTARIGGKNETYGSYLIRIDFVPDRILYDRNQNRYFDAQGEPISFSPGSSSGFSQDRFKRVSTELVYANYCSGGGRASCIPWFQEYLIRSKKVIRSFTLGDRELQDDFRKAAADLGREKIPFSEYHFFYNFFEHAAPFPEWSGLPHLVRLVEKSAALLEEFWKDPENTRTMANPEARTGSPTD